MITVVFLSSVISSKNGAAQSMFDLIESLKGLVHPIILCRAQGEIYDYYSTRGIECYICPYLNVIGSRRHWSHFVFHPWHLRCVKIIRCVRYAAKVLSGKNIDIVHSNEGTIDFGYYLSRYLKAKHVWHIRELLDNSEHLQGERLVSLRLLKRMINKADARIFISNACRHHWGLKNQNTWTLWDAVRSEKDVCYKKVKQQYLLFCSYNITKAKGASFAVTAFGKSGLFAPSVNDNPVRLKMLGKCEEGYKKELLVLAAHFGCEEFIDFLSLQEEVKPYFAYASAFINPSFNEGLGRVTAEAMFYGCPVIALASGGTLDLIKHGETGWLFNTVEECAELLNEVCHKDQEQLILHAQEFAKQNMSIENYGEKILGIYQTVLHNN